MGFAAGSIIHKFYDRTELPSSRSILIDLESVLDVYQSLCDSGMAGVLLDHVSGGEAAVAARVITFISRPAGRGQGFSSNPRIRRTIEDHAMKTAIGYFTCRGWEVKDVHQRNPYDLDCTLECKRIMVEVKGTTTDGASVLLTPNEVDHARAHPREAALFICSDIVVESTQTGKLEAQGGRVHFLYPWEPHPYLLTPVGFSFSVPTDTGSL